MTRTIQPEQAGVLEQEVRTWLERREELVRQAPGKFVVIKDDKILGIFDKKNEAYDQAYRQLGRGPFLLWPIQMEEEVYYIGGSALSGLFMEENIDTDNTQNTRPAKDRSSTAGQD